MTSNYREVEKLIHAVVKDGQSSIEFYTAYSCPPSAQFSPYKLSQRTNVKYVQCTRSSFKNGLQGLQPNITIWGANTRITLWPIYNLKCIKVKVQRMTDEYGVARQQLLNPLLYILNARVYMLQHFTCYATEPRDHRQFVFQSICFLKCKKN